MAKEPEMVGQRPIPSDLVAGSEEDYAIAVISSCNSGWGLPFLFRFTNDGSMVCRLSEADA